MAQTRMPTNSTILKVQTASLFLIAAVAFGVAAYWLADVLVPLVLALFLAMALRPLATYLRDRLKVPHGVAVVLTFLLGFALLAGIGSILVFAAEDIAAQSDVYNERYSAVKAQLFDALPLESMGMSADEANAKLADATDGLSEDAASAAVSLLGTLVSQGMMVLIYLIFLMLGSSVQAPSEEEQQSSKKGLGEEIANQIEAYILLKIGVSLVTAILTYAILAIAGVPLALVFALLTFLLNFIPNIGSAIAMLLPLPLMLLDPEFGMATTVTVLGILGAVQFTVGNIVEPKLLGKSMDLHPVAVLFALVFFGKIWGIVGALLATPLLGVAKILLMRSEYTKRLGNLLSESRQENAQENEAKKSPEST